MWRACADFGADTSFCACTKNTRLEAPGVCVVHIVFAPLQHHSPVQWSQECQHACLGLLLRETPHLQGAHSLQNATRLLLAVALGRSQLLRRAPLCSFGSSHSQKLHYNTKHWPQIVTWWVGGWSGGEVVKFDVGAGRHENDGVNNTLWRVPCECVLDGLRCVSTCTRLWRIHIIV